MNYTKSICLIAIFLLNVAVNNAQTQLGDYAMEKYSVIHPSPEVASLMKYVDYPVSYFTGQPKIEIPIYTLTEGSLSIPIFLSYRGGGLKQNELPGKISYGWTLIAGMTISRNMCGLPDECHINAGRQNTIRGLFNLNSSDIALRNNIINRTLDYDPTTISSEYATYYTDCADYEAGRVDFANDIYKFYGLGISGTFIFDQSQKIELSTSSPITLDSYQGWKHYGYSFTDKDETKYTFGANGVEYTKIPINAEPYQSTDSLIYESAWHITQLKSISGDIINFDYSEPIYKIDKLEPIQYFYRYEQTYFYNNIDRTSLSTRTIKHQERNLISIRSKSSTIRFHYTNNNNKLEAISVHKNDNDTTELWRYSIIRGDSRNMTEIKQIVNSKSLQLYKFDYISKNNTSELAMDYWGYCNGANNTSILPNILGYENIDYKKGNREPNVSYAKEGILNRIDYSTGGYTTFNWEQNDYSYVADNGGYLKDNPQIKISKDTIKLRGTKVQEWLSHSKFLKKGDMCSIDMSRYLEPLMSSGCVFQLEFSSEYNNSYHVSEYPQLNIYRNGQIKNRYYIDKENSKQKIYITGDSAEYKFEIKYPRAFAGMSDIDINAYWGNINQITTDWDNYGYINLMFETNRIIYDDIIKPWGGLRIAEIASFPNIGSSITKQYKYRTKINGKTYSTGVVNSLPYNAFRGYAYFNDGSLGYNISNVYGICSNGIDKTVDGEIGIEYSEVWETIKNPYCGSIGYFFDTHKEHPDVEDCLFSDFVPKGLKTLTDNGYMRGNIKEKHFKGKLTDSDNEDLYKTITYNYNHRLTNSHPVYTGPLYTVCNFDFISLIDGKNDDTLAKTYTICKYNVYPYNKLLSSETTWEKQLNSGNEHTKIITYSYYGTNSLFNPNPCQSFIKSTSYQNSKNKTITSYYTYHKQNGSPIDKKELEIVVIDDIVKFARRFEYDSNGRITNTYSGCGGMHFSTNFTIPQNVRESATFPPIDKLEYHYNYDSNGNITQIEYNNQILASYLWGYAGKHPIVEAKGVKYDELLLVAKNHNYNEQTYITEVNLSDMFKDIRSRFIGKEILTYTFHWLIGMATSTDSTGITTTYLYDDFGRLNGIKDTNDYFINKYDYNYVGF